MPLPIRIPKSLNSQILIRCLLFFITCTISKECRVVLHTEPEGTHSLVSSHCVVDARREPTVWVLTPKQLPCVVRVFLSDWRRCSLTGTLHSDPPRSPEQVPQSMSVLSHCSPSTRVTVGVNSKTNKGTVADSAVLVFAELSKFALLSQQYLLLQPKVKQ